jgi:hypothetical protein
MSKKELLDMLTGIAKEFREDSGHYSRNRHMHSITSSPPQDVIDAVLAGFINCVGLTQGVDYGLYASDLSSPSAADQQNWRRPDQR